MTLAEIMYPRKIRSVFDKLMANRKKYSTKKKTRNKFQELGEKFSYWMYQRGEKLREGWRYRQKNR